MSVVYCIVCASTEQLFTLIIKLVDNNTFLFNFFVIHNNSLFDDDKEDEEI